MTRLDYYVLLGVDRSASKADIRRAFQKLARKYHPDINPGDNVAALRYERISEAFEVLSNPESREHYDEVGARPAADERAEPVRYGFEGFDFSIEERRETNIFPELFTRQNPVPDELREDGEDVHHRINISFEESLTGLSSHFAITRKLSCDSCEGWGEVPASEPVRCPACHGKGRSTQAHGFMLFTKPCAVCRGAGVVARERCPDCAGAGRRSETHLVEVEIPKGVADGDKIAIAGMGGHGRGRGRPGDLFVHVQVQPHPFFTRKGDNLYATVPITFAEAALGAKIEVPTAEGGVTLRVPAGVQSGQMLRLAGRGAPTRRGPGRGDFYVTVKVVTPQVYDDRSRELLRELERINPQEPREDLWRSSEEVST